MGIIYRVTNGHYFYIGKTIHTLEHRFKRHVYYAKSCLNGSPHKKHRRRLYYAMAKYGINTFYIEEVESVSEGDLNQKETDLIAEYRERYGLDRVLNESDGGDGNGSSGEDNPMSKLSNAESEEIKSRRGENQRNLAKIYGVSQAEISMIQTGKRRSSENDHPIDRSLGAGGIGMKRQRQMFLDSSYSGNENPLSLKELCLEYYGEYNKRRAKMVRGVLRKFRDGKYD